jgi:hypothetical protein
MCYLNEGARRLPRAAALAAAGCGAGGAAGPLAGLTGSQVAARALANLKTAPSLHVADTMSTSGQTVTLNVSLSKAGGCSGTVAMSGSAAPFDGTVQVTVTGKTVYILPDQKFWDSVGGSGGGPLAGKWIRLGPGDQNASSFTQFCTAAALAAALAPTPGSLSRSAGPLVSGTPALYVTRSSPSGSAEANPELSSVPSSMGQYPDLRDGKRRGRQPELLRLRGARPRRRAPCGLHSGREPGRTLTPARQPVTTSRHAE